MVITVGVNPVRVSKKSVFINKMTKEHFLFSHAHPPPPPQRAPGVSEVKLAKAFFPPFSYLIPTGEQQNAFSPLLSHPQRCLVLTRSPSFLVISAPPQHPTPLNAASHFRDSWRSSCRQTGASNVPPSLRRFVPFNLHVATLSPRTLSPTCRTLFPSSSVTRRHLQLHWQLLSLKDNRKVSSHL